MNEIILDDSVLDNLAYYLMSFINDDLAARYEAETGKSFWRSEEIEVNDDGRKSA